MILTYKTFKLFYITDTQNKFLPGLEGAGTLFPQFPPPPYPPPPQPLFLDGLRLGAGVLNGCGSTTGRLFPLEP